jgi:hypothetical protein
MPVVVPYLWSDAGAALVPGEKLIHYPPGLVERSEALPFFVLLARAAPLGVYICYAWRRLEGSPNR